MNQQAQRVMERCLRIAKYSEEPGVTTRTFLSPPMHGVHSLVREWMEQAGMSVRIDAAGNIRGVLHSLAARAKRVIVGSHLDTVPRAGAFDGVLGVIMGIAVCEAVRDAPLPFHIEVIGFSEEEGVRFRTPFLGSLALIGELNEDLLDRRDTRNRSVSDAIREFGLDPVKLPDAAISHDAIAYFEFHIEQGPVLDQLGLPLAVVDGIVGQSRLGVTFEGQSNHAGTTPMEARRDALTGAAEWVLEVEREAALHQGITATVGVLEVEPGAGNVIPGSAGASLDVRHRDDAVRRDTVNRLLVAAKRIADRRGLSVSFESRLDQGAVPMNQELAACLAVAVDQSGLPVHRMFSGAGHDAMILAQRVPAAMLFLRSPGGISHDPRETVREDDVHAGLCVGQKFLRLLGQKYV